MRIDPSTIETLFLETLERSKPERLIPSILKTNSNLLHLCSHTIDLTAHQKIFIIGSGKASVEMANATIDILGDKLSGGLIITNSTATTLPEKFEVLKSSHPVPNEQSTRAAGRLIEFIQSVPSKSIVLNLLSGGTSSLLCIPPKSISADDLANLYRILLNSGASINEVNLVRKTVSEIKAGRLLQYFRDVTLLDLIISDVPNDEIKDIGSGPTISQSFLYSDAISLLKYRNIWENIPKSVQTFLLNSAEKNDQFKSHDIKNHHSNIIQSADKVATIAKELMEQEGIRVTKDDKPWTGSIEDFEQYIMSKIQPFLLSDNKPIAFIFFGECSVNVTGEGKGGRNQELALRMAKHLDELEQEIIFLSAGTDGIDGSTDAAGAVVNQNSLKEARKLGLNADDFLRNNDSYSFFDILGSHIKTGPTGNNVMDLQFLIVQ